MRLPTTLGLVLFFGSAFGLPQFGHGGLNVQPGGPTRMHFKTPSST
jgi:hypothetical protein